MIRREHWSVTLLNRRQDEDLPQRKQAGPATWAANLQSNKADYLLHSKCLNLRGQKGREGLTTQQDWSGGVGELGTCLFSNDGVRETAETGRHMGLSVPLALRFHHRRPLRKVGRSWSWSAHFAAMLFVWNFGLAANHEAKKAWMLRRIAPLQGFGSTRKCC